MSQIRVLITDERNNTDTVTGGGSSTKTTNGAVTKNQVVKNNQVKDSQENSELLALGVMVGKQALNYTTSNVGKWTGSTRIQTAVNGVTEIVGTIGMIAVNPIIGIANVGINLATTSLNTTYEQVWDANNKEYARKRVGEVKGRGR